MNCLDIVISAYHSVTPAKRFAVNTVSRSRQQRISFMCSTIGRSAHIVACAVLALLFHATGGAALAQPAAGGSGVIEDRVVDSASGEPLPGVQVPVTGSTAETSTDRDGRFRLSAVPAGDRTVVVTYLGRQDVAADQIGSFPDRNAAETSQRIPGVSIVAAAAKPPLNSTTASGTR